MEVKNVMCDCDSRDYRQLQEFYWEGRILLINYYLKGSVVVNYYRYPNSINSTTTDDYIFEVDLDAQELIPLYIAAHVLIDENSQIATLMLNEYQQKLDRLRNVEPSGFTSIANVYE
jgi:hypothetical protein